MSTSRELPNNPKRIYPFNAREWFSVNQVGNNIWGIREPHHDQDVVSYFIYGKTRDILIDSGMGLADISQTSPLLNRAPEKQLVVLLTHTHWDHIGGASLFSDVRVFNDPYETNRLSKGWGKGEMPGFGTDYFLNIEIPPTYSPDDFEIPGVPSFKTLQDGEKISTGDDSLKVINTPGHTPGSTSFLLEKAGYLFTGDTLYVGPVYLHMNESDYGAFQASIDKLSEQATNLRSVFPAHNDAAITPEKFQELLSLIRGGKTPDIIETGSDEFNSYHRKGWNMRDMGQERTFSLLMP